MFRLACRNINEATTSIPIIGDGDTGYGNALSVKRTVNGFANAGFAGILIEDQASRTDFGWNFACIDHHLAYHFSCKTLKKGLPAKSLLLICINP